MIEYKFTVGGWDGIPGSEEQAYIDSIAYLVNMINCHKLEMIIVNGMYVYGAEKVDYCLLDDGIVFQLLDMDGEVVGAINLEICKTKFKCHVECTTALLKIA